MKKLLSLLLLFSYFSLSQVHAQKKFAVKWAPAGLYFGSFNLLGEYKLTKRASLTAKIGIPMEKNYSATYDDKDASLKIKATSFLAGYRMYMSRKGMRGFYFEPFFNYLHHEGNGIGASTLNGQPVTMNFTSRFTGYGVGIQAGVQFLIAKRVALDLYFLGPELNTVDATFISKEVTNTLPWNSTQAAEAEQDARDFINDIPIIGKKIKLTVDQNNRTVTSSYNGILPGFRAGIAIGIAF
jgi:hypothetical protein